MANFKQSKYMSDSILQQVTSLGVSPDAMVANIARSGQLGTGIRVNKLDGVAPAVFNPTVGILLQSPSVMDRYPKWVDMLKASVESHAKSITGIDFGYELETATTLVGHDGQNMEVPMRTTRGSVSPSFTFTEGSGMPFYNLFKFWMFAIQHPDTNASIMPANVSDVSEIPAWQMTAYSMSMLFIQYDPTGLPDRIYDAIVVTNMFPKSLGDIGFERTIGTTQMKERTISMSGIVQHNEQTRALGVSVARLLNLHRINYNFALPGVAANADAEIAIDSTIRSFGGIEYEANGNGSVAGASTQFTYQGDGGDAAYSDLTQPGSTPIPSTGAATSG